MKVNVKDILIGALAALVVAAVGFYIFLPAINLKDKGFVAYAAVVLLVFTVVCYLRAGWRGGTSIIKEGFRIGVPEIAAIAAVALVVLCTVIGAIGSTKILRAKSYQQLLNVQEGDFETDVLPARYDNIPMLDRDSAQRLGDRKMGELLDMVSQFEVATDYSQINFNGAPVRVTPLVYSDLIKWFNNQSKGLPAYVMINMVTQEVTVERLEQGMKYSFSDHFGRYLPRHLRFKYPTYLFDPAIFEVNDAGHPYWVVPRISYKVGLYGGKDVVGVVLCDAVTGATEYYDLSEIPQWIDRAVSADMVMEQFDYYGTLKHGFWNSLFGQRDSLITTEGYNYLAMNDDIYLYTGVTSVVSDKSNVGFLMVNQRTKAAKFYSAPGADETSAMSSAQGQVQHLGYKATFPLLLNIGGQPTYFLALKDEAQLVKKYAMVNVGQYQIVAIGDTVLECEKEYVRLMAAHGIDSGEIGSKSVTGKITDIRTAVIDGSSVYYLQVEGVTGMFTVPVAKYNEVVTFNVGDTVKIDYVSADSMLNAIYAMINLTQHPPVTPPTP